MDGDTIIVTTMLSIAIVVVLCGIWIWTAGKLRRRPGLPPPDRSCDRDWYSVGRDAR
jgi:hypothetical protein